MAASTFAEQLRIAIVTESVAKYRLEMAVTDPGELPDSEVFLIRIGAADDPKSDEFERVIGVGDFFTWSVKRTDALAAGDAFYRTASLIKTYGREEGGIQTAINAKDFLAEEVNRLVEEYIAFDTEFRADPPELFEFPEPDVGVLTPLIEDYVAKTAEVDAQEEILADKVVECAQLDQAYQDALSARDVAQATLDSMTRTRSAMQSSVTAMQAFQTASVPLSDAVIAALNAWEANRAAMSPPTEVQNMDDHLRDDTPGPAGTLWDEYYNYYVPAVRAHDEAVVLSNSELTEIGNRITDQTNVRDAAQNDLDNALVAKETCAADQASIEAVLDKLKQQQTALLADIIALCPGFTPPV